MIGMLDKNYNILAQYEVIGRVPNGKYIVGYVVRNRMSGETSMLQKDIVEQLALCKNIYNVSAQIYDNIVNLKGIGCKLSQLPKYSANGAIINNEDTRKVQIEPFLKIIGRVQRSRVVCGYILEYKDNKDNTVRKKFSKDKVLELARAGYIINAKAQLNNGELMLRGTSEDLGMLKTIKEN